jgi:hypothetical protein
VHASDGTTALLYRSSGCRIVTVAVDMVAVRRGAAGELAAARQQDAIR